MTKQEIINDFDPNGVGIMDSLFGLPFDENTAELIIIPVPWEVTVSYSNGTGEGPEAILKASTQVDLYQEDIRGAWKLGIYLLPVPEEIKGISIKYRAIASEYIQWLESGSPEAQEEDFKLLPDKVDQACQKMNDWVYAQAKHYREKGKLVALLGGDHSTPLGLIKAVAEDHANFGVLQIDAHADLRVAYENFTYSHASISYNFIELPQISKLVQVGIRDICEAEMEMADQHPNITLFHDSTIKAAQYEGKTWKSICEEIIRQLPDEVYITFDIDGLDPKLCPHTGTPVAGGFELEQILYLIKQLVKTGKKIIGFDLVEVAPGEEDEWDGNVAARLLYRMSNLYGASQGKLELR
ncbi:MAG: agmatinase family protein [Anditalea sp.]